ncbi:hypothetical protein AB0P02_21370 [Streptomyces griseoluteus]|uniref:hypothetical protein n=1 Tax=Streptomyces griseoluteus TaxID=29306 RepID=UPI003437919B
MSATADGFTFDPFTYYDITIRDDNSACINYGQTFDAPCVYSNAGVPRVQCGRCGKPMTITAATRLDPQPEMS